MSRTFYGLHSKVQWSYQPFCNHTAQGGTSARLDFPNSEMVILGTGDQRHATSHEAFSLLFSRLENKLLNSEAKLVVQMMKGEPEWVDLAIERPDNNTVVLYTHPRGLVFRKDKHQKGHDFDATGEVSFQYTANGRWFPAYDCDLVTALYGIPYTEWPPVLQKENHRLKCVRIVLPPVGECAPVARIDWTLSAQSKKAQSRGVTLRP